MSYCELYERLTNKGFKAINIRKVNNQGFEFFKNNETKKGVLIKKIILKEDINIAIEGISTLRGMLLANGENIWNTYLIIYFENPLIVNNEEAYLLEREEKGFRRYVILNDNDIDRIPFLDNTEPEPINDLLYGRIDGNTGDEYLKEINGFLKDQKAGKKLLSNNELQICVDNVIRMLEAKYEIE